MNRWIQIGFGAGLIGIGIAMGPDKPLFFWPILAIGGHNLGRGIGRALWENNHG